MTARIENPLKKKINSEFVKNIPSLPGVYCLLDEWGRVLYIGKTKHLKKRLNSYRQIRVDRASLKKNKLVNLVSRIEWEVCSSEEQALWFEKRLLQKFRPPFNTSNIHTKSYYLIEFKMEYFNICLKLYTVPNAQSNVYTFGVFDKKNSTKKAFGSLVKLLWLATSGQRLTLIGSAFKYPGFLARRNGVSSYDVEMNIFKNKRHIKLLKLLLIRFLRGKSELFLMLLTRKLLDNEQIPSTMYDHIQKDLTSLMYFFKKSLKYNYSLIKLGKVKNWCLTRDEFDELSIKYRHQIKNKLL